MVPGQGLTVLLTLTGMGDDDCTPLRFATALEDPGPQLTASCLHPEATGLLCGFPLALLAPFFFFPMLPVLLIQHIRDKRK